MVDKKLYKTGRDRGGVVHVMGNSFGEPWTRALCGQPEIEEHIEKHKITCPNCSWQMLKSHSIKENKIEDWMIIVDKDECEFMLPNNHKGPNDCNYGEDVVLCDYDNCQIKSSML